MHDAYELSKFFAEATESEKTDALLSVCDRDPHLLLEIVRNISGTHWKNEARRLLNENSKIDAIKYCRQVTGWGLREAKEAVEAL